MSRKISKMSAISLFAEERHFHRGSTSYACPTRFLFLDTGHRLSGGYNSLLVGSRRGVFFRKEVRGRAFLK
jgi:hypothetical protein